MMKDINNPTPEDIEDNEVDVLELDADGKIALRQQILDNDEINAMELLRFGLNSNGKYDRVKIANYVEKVITENNLYFEHDLIGWLPFGIDALKEIIGDKTPTWNNILTKLDSNRIADKIKIREKLLRSDRSTELLPLYRLLGEEEERRRLSASYIRDGESAATISAQSNGFHVVIVDSREDLKKIQDIEEAEEVADMQNNEYDE